MRLKLRTFRSGTSGTEICEGCQKTQLTYPEFHFETETKVDSLTGMQRYKGNYVLSGCL